MKNNKAKEDKPNTLREDLINKATTKPIRKYFQADVFNNIRDYDDDDPVRPDKDGDCVSAHPTYELRNTHSLRVLIPSGTTKAEAIRGLKKVIGLINEDPHICSWNWGYVEELRYGRVVREPEIGIAFMDYELFIPLLDKLSGLSANEFEQIVEATKILSLNDQELVDDLPF